MTERPDSLAERYARLARESPRRGPDVAIRALDIAFSLLFSLVALPFGLGVAVAILVTTGRPMLYSGERVGRAGRVFTMHKFRTLKSDAESRLGGYLGPELVERTRGEVTRLGRWLRATQLDELPQFWNVLRGDMSFVGPRPERPYFVAELARALPFYQQRHAVKPGVTGWAQVKYRYGSSLEDATEKLRYDLYYVKHMSIVFDLTIVFDTVKVVLFGRGAA
jgi:lipopolysaccharide/colanic/teichoic acid biosynthesis glycosyltransferase